MKLFASSSCVALPTTHESPFMEARAGFHMATQAAYPARTTQPAQALLSFSADLLESRYGYLQTSSHNLFGYSLAELHKIGPGWINTAMHPADGRVYNASVLPAIVRVLKIESPFTHNQYFFSFNFRLQTRAGGYITVLQRAAYTLCASTGRLSGVNGFITDISHFKQDASMVFTIEKHDAEITNASTMLVYKAVYHPDEKKQLLSRRELEILQLIHQGACSKEIAEKLRISIYTINNHRKNMLYKTGCKNFTQLFSSVLAPAAAWPALPDDVP